MTFIEQMALIDIEQAEKTPATQGREPLAMGECCRDATPPGTPQNALESQLHEIWEEVLGRNDFSTHDRFGEIGGTSAHEERVLGLIEDRLGRRLDRSTLARFATIEEISHFLLRDQQRGSARQPYVVLHPTGDKRPFFFLHGDYVGGGFFCKTLAGQIGERRPFYAVHPHGLLGDVPPHSIRAMAADRLSAIRAVQPAGPYLLGGYCNGALVAFEMARLLEAEGEEVSALVMLMADGSNYWLRHLYQLSQRVAAWRKEEPLLQQQRFLSWLHRAHFLRGFARHYAGAARGLLRQRPMEVAKRLARKTWRIVSRLRGAPSRSGDGKPRFAQEILVSDAFSLAAANFIPSRYQGQITLLWPEQQSPEEGGDETYGWASICPFVRLLHVPGDHHSCVSQARNVRSIGETMRGVLEAADPASRGTEPGQTEQ